MTEPTDRPGEFDVIARYFAPLSRTFPGAAGLTNDTATLTIAPGLEAVVTMDTMIAGVHFMPDDPPDLIARKLVRVNLSDLASSGATPLVYFLAMSLGHDIDEAWIAEFARGLETDQQIFGISLGGGDTTVTPGPLTLSLTAIGQVPAGQTIGRSGASPGQDIYVSGTVGDAALALEMIGAAGVEGALSTAPALVSRYRLPEPRVSLGAALLDFGTAAVDVSDGLLADLGHICDASGVGAIVHFADLPLSPAARDRLADRPDLADLVIGGGDDYELLFVARSEDADALESAAASLEVPIAKIGQTIEKGGATVIGPSGRAMSPASAGWRHF